MFNYKEISNNCRRLGLNPRKRGDNIMAKSRPVYAKKEPTRLHLIKFPTEEKIQMEMIGRLIYNLVSQEVFPRGFDMSKKSQKAYKRQQSIDKILPVAKASHKEWFEQGLQKTAFKMSDFMIHNGMIYTVDEKAIKNMERLNEELREFKRESDRKQARSWQDVKNLIINT